MTRRLGEGVLEMHGQETDGPIREETGQGLPPASYRRRGSAQAAVAREGRSAQERAADAEEMQPRVQEKFLRDAGLAGAVGAHAW